MKTFLRPFVLGSLAASSLFFFQSTNVSARDLTYRFGAGWRQAYSNAIVDKHGNYDRTQVNGLEVGYGIARDIQAEAYFGFTSNFGLTLLGPKLRYDFQRLIKRDSAAWNYLNLYTEAAFLAKFGNKVKGGITMHLPYLGFEIFPFTNNNFCLSSSAGLVFDFVSKNKIGFTQGLLGDLGIKYYF